MPPRRCCCGVSCKLGSDDFDREVIGNQWHVVSGEWSIVDNHLEGVGEGILATTICHPDRYIYGSWIGSFDLVNVRTQTRFAVGGGNPNSSGYYIEYIPSGIDTLDAKITVRVVGDNTEEYDFPWPVDFNGQSANQVRAYACYLPGAIIRGHIGPAPEVDACISIGGAQPCYPGDPDLGNFFFIEGHFDNWNYESTLIDDFNCPPCGCFCFKRSGNEKEFSCLPDQMTAVFELITGECSALDGLEVTLFKGTASPNDGTPTKQRWFSEIQSCYEGGTEFTLVLECETISKDGMNWFWAPALRIGNILYQPSTIVFNWSDPYKQGTALPFYSLSTCEPLSLVYGDLIVQSMFGPCGEPGQFGYFPFCCDLPYDGCYETPPDIRLRVTVIA
jgi:hypothetical protein